MFVKPNTLLQFLPLYIRPRALCFVILMSLVDISKVRTFFDTCKRYFKFLSCYPVCPLHSTKVRIFFKLPNFILKLLFGSFNTAHVAIKCSFNSSSTHYTLLAHRFKVSTRYV